MESLSGLALELGLATENRGTDIRLAREELEKQIVSWVNSDTIEMSSEQRVFFDTFIARLREYLTYMTCDKPLVDSAKLELHLSNIDSFFNNESIMFTVTFSDDYERLVLHYTSTQRITSHELLAHYQKCCGMSCEFYGCNIYGDGVDHRIECDGNMCRTYHCKG